VTQALALRDRTFSPDDPVRVTICSITFNHAAFIRDCLEGFLDQVCDFRVEVVIHDDASTDCTTEIIRDYAARYPTLIRPILQVENQWSKGVNPYYAYVFPAARGEYLALCDGDDHWCDPGKLAAQVAVLDREPGVALTYGRTDAMEDGVLNRAFVNGAERDLSPEELKCCDGINTLTTCFRNVFHGDPPPFLRQSPIGDLTVWAVLGYHGSGRFMADLPPTVYNIHSGGVLSRVPPKRQVMMSALAYMNIAAYHGERGDTVASQASAMRAAATSIPPEYAVMIRPAKRLSRLRKALKKLSRRLRGKA
jgi:glycosyltransferase involved in cell wall biosynthesis